jgi:hypothetical protein
MSDYNYQGTAAHTRAEEERSTDDENLWSDSGGPYAVPNGYCPEDDDRPAMKDLEQWTEDYYADRESDVLMHVANECDEELKDLVMNPPESFTLKELQGYLAAMQKKVNEKVKEEYESWLAEHGIEE